MTRILVIDDATPLRNDIVEMLSFEGYDVKGASNGLEGINIALEFQPDLIICDVMMPELDGYGVLDALRKDERTVSTPFIFLTAKTDARDVRHGMGLGADDYLTKPFVTSELLETINARLEKKNAVVEMLDNKLRELSDSIITALPHELRTPLNTIIGFSEMLMTEAPHLTPDQTVDWANHINMAAQRLYRLVENYLLYVRAEIVSRDSSELQSLNDRYVEHPDMFLQFHAMHKAQQAGRSDDMVFNAHFDGKVRISDHDLGKIVEELIDNAFKFSNVGTAVTLETYAEDDFYVLVVTDRGHGMAPGQIQSIGAYMQFERWFYEQQGSGFGLTIVRRLAELHGGTVEITSEINVGTQVIVRLKLA